jgi:Major Facilitator Superfamily
MYGNGLLIVSMPLYCTRIVHLSAERVGLGMTIAAAVTLLATLPIGDLADRRGPLEVTKAILLVQCGSALAFLFIRNLGSFVAVATADMLAARAILSAEGALLRRVAGEDMAGFRASTHAITNLGFSIGIACSGIAIELDTPTAYHVLISVDALTFLGTWVVLCRLPRYDPLPKPATAPRWGVLLDRPFVAFSVLAAAMSLEFSVITLLLPLWVVDHTHAPRWCIPMTLLINTTLVVFLQIRIGSKVQTIREGGAAWRRAGVVFLLSCSAIGLAAGLPGWAALVLLATGVCLHTFGEIWHMAAGFAIGFNLPPAHAQGQYDGFIGIVGGLGGVVAPVLLLGFVLSLGRAGLFGLGAYFALAGLLMPAVARWGERTRPASPDVADLQEASVVGEAAGPRQ